jgi:hypothetical protein
MADWQPLGTTQKSNLPHQPLTIERLERGLVVTAYLMERHRLDLAPIFEKLERELAKMKSDQDAIGRAKQLLESYRTAGGVKAIA